MSSRQELPIRVNHPRRLPGWSLPAERIPVGRPGDYKPNLAVLPGGELVMVAFHKTGTLRKHDFHEVTTLWRSHDGGRTWSARTDLDDVIGREPFLTCTPDGVLFLTSTVLPADSAFDGYFKTPHAALHRSTDGGRTWTRKRVLIEGDLRQGTPMDVSRHRTQRVRNVVALPDGTLLLGVSIGGRNPGNRTTVNAYMWASHDGGVRWDENRPVKLLGSFDNHWGFFPEGFMYRNDADKLLFWSRVASSSPMYPMDDGRLPPSAGRQLDRLDRTLWYESVDDGLTWTPRGDFGDYGQMFPRVTKLHDGRLLMTYTQRALLDPVGLRARLSCDDGESWDFDYDQIVIEGFTPWGARNGGGFGNTVQLEDGTLVSCYSFNPGDVTNPSIDPSQIHVVRWRLP